MRSRCSGSSVITRVIRVPPSAVKCLYYSVYIVNIKVKLKIDIVQSICYQLGVKGNQKGRNQKDSNQKNVIKTI